MQFLIPGEGKDNAGFIFASSDLKLSLSHCPHSKLQTLNFPLYICLDAEC
jgi:hypothetical protein